VSKLDSDLDVDEDLLDYWSAIPGPKQKTWYANEVYMRNSLKLKTLTSENLEKLRTSKIDQKLKKKQISNTVNYEILTNRFYAEGFQYESIDARNEPEDFDSSDIIDRVLHMSQFHKFDPSD